MCRNTATQFGLVSKCLHWSMALLIIALIVLGWLMVGMDYYNPWATPALDYHKALGMLVLILCLLRLAWLLCSITPAESLSLKQWERFLAKSVHRIFYLLMLLIPISGYVISTSLGAGIDIWGYFEFPALFTIGDGVKDWAIAWHFYLAYFIAVLLLLHTLAAFKHQFIDKDGTLKKML